MEGDREQVVHLAGPITTTIVKEEIDIIHNKELMEITMANWVEVVIIIEEKAVEIATIKVNVVKCNL